MDRIQRINNVFEQIVTAVNRASSEYELTKSEVVGILEIIKFEVITQEEK